MRSEEGAYLVDGPVLLAEALDAGATVRTVYVEAAAGRPAVAAVVAAAAAAGVRVREVVPGALGKVLELGTPQSVVAVVEQERTTLDEALRGAVTALRPLLVLVDVGDPGNVGTLVRTAEASGCAGVVLAGSCADLFNPKTVRATAGAIFRVPVAAAADLAEVATATAACGAPLVATVGGAAPAPETVDLAADVVIVVGSEAHGLDDADLARCDLAVSIPMDGLVESLNAAVAGSVVAFEAARQRRARGSGPGLGDRSGEPTAAVGHDGDPVVTGRPSDRPAPEHGSPPR